MLEEAEGKARLRRLGLPVPDGLVVSGAGVVAAAEELGYPVVLKMMGPRLAHKSEAGAVAVELESGAHVSSALDRMRRSVADHDRHAVTDRFLVEAMAPRPIGELILSIRSDPQFGRALIIGSGGILTELVGDSTTLLLPATGKQIEMALRTLKAAKLLDGYRGGRRANLASLATRIAQFAAILTDRADDIAEVEINPLFVHEENVLAVDVLIHEWHVP